MCVAPNATGAPIPFLVLSHAMDLSFARVVPGIVPRAQQTPRFGSNRLKHAVRTVPESVNTWLKAQIIGVCIRCACFDIARQTSPAKSANAQLALCLM